jgi:hypothetical protein
MDSFGNVLAAVVAEIITLIEGTLSHYVDITFVDGNMTNVSLSSVGESFCLNWSNLLVSFAGAMNSMMTALWSTSSS